MGFARLVASLDLSEAARGSLRTAREDEWVPAAHQTEALRALTSTFGDGPDFLYRFGAAQCERDVPGPLGWLFKLLAPGTLLAHMSVVWRQFHSTGEWVAREDGPSLHAALHHWDGGSREACEVLRGYLSRLIQLSTGDPEAQLEETACRFDPDRPSRFDACEFSLRHRLTDFQRLPVPDVQAKDVPVIGLHLTQLGSVAEVAETFRHAVVALLPGCDARLELERPGAAESEVLWDVGGAAEGTLRYQWPLDAAGNVIGRLYVGGCRTDLDDTRRGLLSALAPWAGVALLSRIREERSSSVPPAPPAARASQPPPSWDERVEAAAAVWKLTPRQREVLARVVTGESNRQIAMGLGIAEGTVEVHVARLLKAAGVDGRTRLIAKVVKGEAEVGGPRRFGGRG